MTFLRCKDFIVEVDEVALISRFDAFTGPPTRRHPKIAITLKSGRTVHVDYTHADEANSTEPRDRAFEDIWRALNRKIVP